MIIFLQRQAKQKSLDDEIRFRIRFQGLILAEPEEEEEQIGTKIIILLFVFSLFVLKTLFLFIKELTEEHLLVVNKALGQGNPQEVLVEGFNLQIRRSDIQTLSGLNWLNDEARKNFNYK